MYHLSIKKIKLGKLFVGGIFMSFNPFLAKPKKIESTIMNFKMLAPKPYNKDEVDPYTRVRCILMNGTEYEAVWSKHHLNRHCGNNDIRRAIGLIRNCEQQQQKLISTLKPIDENLLQTTLGYEQLAVDLTAILAQRQTNSFVKNALDFALLEDFDHLYRYANLLETDMGDHAEKYIGSYTEIMPSRPTVAHHRHPYDNIKKPISNMSADPITKCDVSIITAAEQQTMNYYMNLGSFYKNQKGREIYSEIAMVEEEHVSQYGSLIDPSMTMLDDILMHEYIECYLYYSMHNNESDPHIKQIWEMLFEQELAHLHFALEIVRKYENKDWFDVLPNGEFPELIAFAPQKEYIRKVLAETICNTCDLENYCAVNKLPDNARFFEYQKKVIKDVLTLPSHLVIENHIKQFKTDYRLQDKEHPVKSLRNRKEDNTTIGRVKKD